MHVDEICIFCASTITIILTVVTYSVLWHYHGTIPFNKRSTMTYLSQLLICCITCLVTISVSFIQKNNKVGMPSVEPLHSFGISNKNMSKSLI